MGSLSFSHPPTIIDWLVDAYQSRDDKAAYIYKGAYDDEISEIL